MSTDTDTQTRRLANLRELVDRFDLNTGMSTSAGEDIAPFLAGDTEIGAWAAITEGYGNSGDIIRYWYSFESEAEARVGDIRRTGANKTEAKAALLEALQAQAEHAFTRRYLAGDNVVFALGYHDGWRYDIVRAGDGRQYSSTLLSAETVDEAFESMRHHFDQYTAAPAVAS
jgi:hypothetical protein